MYDPGVYREAEYDYGKVKRKRAFTGITKGQLWDSFTKHGYGWGVNERFPVEAVSLDLNIMPMDVLFMLEYFLNLNWYKDNLRPVTVEIIKKRYKRRKMNWGIDWKIVDCKMVQIAGNNYKPKGKKKNAE